MCVTRILEHWSALTDSIKDATEHDHLLISQRINGVIQNPIFKLVPMFPRFVLSKFTRLNLIFQSSSSLMPRLHMELKSVIWIFSAVSYRKIIGDIVLLDQSILPHNLKCFF